MLIGVEFVDEALVATLLEGALLVGCDDCANDVGCRVTGVTSAGEAGPPD